MDKYRGAMFFDSEVIATCSLEVDLSKKAIETAPSSRVPFRG